MNAILTSTKSSLLRSVLGLLASAALVATATPAFAGTKELVALEGKLGKPVGTATSSELASAIVFFTNPVNNPSKLNPGVIAGEALRGAGNVALDAGAQIAAALTGITFPVRYGSATQVLSKEQFAVAAIKTTGSGKLLTLVQVPDFVAGLFNQNEAVTLAVDVKATKGASGAVFRGAASLISGAAAKATYANTQLATKALASVVQDVAKGIASTLANSNDSATFTDALVGAGANNKLLLKIIPGIVAGKPTDAGVITSTAFANTLYAPSGSVSPVVKGAASLAKSIGAVADIEQIQKVGAAIAAQIPITTVQKGKTVPNIKLSAATSIISTLAKSIAAKPFASLIGGKGTDPALASASAALVKNSEKADELGELAAYFISALSTSAEFTATKVVKGVTVAANADKIVVSILKAVIGGAKIAVGKTIAKVPQAPTKQDVVDYTLLMAKYVAGSVALTVRNLPAGPVRDSITAALKKVGFGKSVAGATNGVAVDQAIKDGFDVTVTGRFENGTVPLTDGIGAVTGSLTDPETNTRNF